MDWLTQNWPLILVTGAFGWMMFRKGGCCGGMSEPDSRKPQPPAAGPAEDRR